MDWLSQNWVWIALLVGGYVLATRHGGGCCGGNRTRRRDGHDGRHENGTRHENSTRPGDPLALTGGRGNTIDPVSKRPLPDLVSASSVFGGRTFYFETPENRAAFERDPRRYALETHCASGTCGPEPSHGCC